MANVRKVVLLAFLPGLSNAHGAEQEEPLEPPVSRLGEVTITSTRTSRTVDSIPDTVTVIRKKQIEASGARTLKELLVDEIDLSVRQAPTRFSAVQSGTGRAGVEGINIRGLEGNRVLMMIDGIRVPEAFSFNTFSTGRGNYIDLDGLRSVEILRGPASTQYGSDGLAGAVSFRTLSPADVLKPKENRGGFARLAYAEVDRSWSQTLAYAQRSEQWQMLVTGNYQEGEETANKGDNASQNANRTKPNPESNRNYYALGKLIWTPNSEHWFSITAEGKKRQQNNELYSARAIPPYNPSPRANVIIDGSARESTERQRVSLDYRFDDMEAPWWQKAEAKLYWQHSKINQWADEVRYLKPTRERDNTYKTDVIGLSTSFESNLHIGVPQRLVYGIQGSQTQVKGVRDGVLPGSGETFPSKPFPDTRYTQLGAFIQNEIEIGAFSVIPGLRFDHYRLNPSDNGYKGQVVSLSDRALTPRLGVVWRALPVFSPYLQWSRGFKAPTPDQVNSDFSNLSHGYRTVGNPNLKPERARSLEAGVRGEIGVFRYAVSAYHNHYTDFISRQSVGGAFRPDNPTIFKYINFEDVTIKGTEWRNELSFAPGWLAHAGMAYAKGESQSKGKTEPLDSINPLKAILGVSYDGQQSGWRLHVTYSKGKEPSNVTPLLDSRNQPTLAAFTPPSYTIVDVGGYWKPVPRLTLQANINNLFDRKYWRWSDVRGLAEDSSVKDVYTAPGRMIQLSAKYDF